MLFALLRMKYRTLTCAPTNVVIIEVVSRVLKLSLKVDYEIKEIILDYRVKRLTKCFGPLASEEVELVLHSKDDKLLPQNRCDPYHLCSIRSHCLSVLRALQDFLSELKLPSAMDKASIVQFYFQSATLLNSTACSSYKLYNFEMKPLNFLVIKEATQLKECEPAIPMQFSDIVRSVLIGDKWKFSATVISYVSSEAGFRRKSISKVDYFGSFKASTEYSVQNASIY
ncbi:hypothetical protein V6N11_080253 [Hibiscus sabdariffa]|uniref:Uncharacterized protein n=1 Tax=Hibiscus sabdariffa TaxID=183260 RepID=A0ABR2R758_9ROSI